MPNGCVLCEIVALVFKSGLSSWRTGELLRDRVANVGPSLVQRRYLSGLADA